MPLLPSPVPALSEAQPPSPEALTLVCLCARWCNVCQQYRAPFEALAHNEGLARVLWVDIEDEDELVSDIEVETFPTLLIADRAGVRFFGPLPPQIPVLENLLPRLAQAPLLADPQIQALWRRIEASCR